MMAGRSIGDIRRNSPKFGEGILAVIPRGPGAPVNPPGPGPKLPGPKLLGPKLPGPKLLGPKLPPLTPGWVGVSGLSTGVLLANC